MYLVETSVHFETDEHSRPETLYFEVETEDKDNIELIKSVAKLKAYESDIYAQYQNEGINITLDVEIDTIIERENLTIDTKIYIPKEEADIINSIVGLDIESSEAVEVLYEIGIAEMDYDENEDCIVPENIREQLKDKRWAFNSDDFSINNKNYIVQVQIVFDDLYIQGLLYEKIPSNIKVPGNDASGVELVERECTEPIYDNITGEWNFEIDGHKINIDVIAETVPEPDIKKAVEIIDEIYEKKPIEKGLERE